MKNTSLLTKMARSMLIAGMVLGITGVVYAQGGAGGAAGAVGAGIGAGSAGVEGQAGPGSGGIAGQAGGMSNTSKALPGLGQDSSRSGQAVPGLGSSARPQGGAAIEQDIPGKKHTSRASSRMKGAEAVGGESASMGVGSSEDAGALRTSPVPPRYPPRY
ncbi:MAG TPA: hypothetical protein VL380_10360 [Nitrosospira sp.]|jgi:hypothetical protein|nr:hypothetical protein [Nitrosospira sp.]